MKRQTVHALQPGFRSTTMIVLLLLCIGCPMLTAQTYQNKIDLNLKNATLTDFFSAIEEQSNYRFLYDAADINVSKTISVDYRNTAVGTILQNELGKANIAYELEGNQIVLKNQQPSPQGISSPANQNQVITITGRIIDPEGIAIPGANIVLKGTTLGTLSDDQGNYSITLPADASNPVLTFAFMGFISKDETVGSRSVINVSLQEEMNKLDEIIVVGYGTQKKSDLTGGVISLGGEKIERIPATNIAQRLQGQVPGLTISNTNNAPGEASRIRVRGEKSLSGGNSPLIVLDGIPFNGDMSEIDQNSIENISVLKDASAAAIYGARAANGVILITTKKGTKGKPIIRYNGYMGVQTAEWLPDLMNSPENIQLIKDYRRDRNFTDYNDPEAWLFEALIGNFNNGKETDWLKEVFRPAMQQEHQVSLAGTTDALNYYASLAYTDQDGIVKYTGYKKYAATVNMTQKVGTWLTVGTNIQMNQRDQGGVTPRHAFAYRMSPYASVRDESGKYIRYPMWSETLYYSPFANQDGTVDNIYRGVYTNWFGEVQLPIKGFSYRTNFGYAYRNQEKGSYYGSTTMEGEPFDGVATINKMSYRDWTWENILRYTYDSQKHHIDFTGLYSAQQTHKEESEMKGKGFLSDESLYHNIGMAQGEKTFKSSMKETALVSYMARINYGYDGRYLLTLTGRRDGYSAFGPNNKWAFFPSVAGAWVASKETFFQDMSIAPIELLKFRLSYGANGNQAISPYQTLTKMTQQDYIFGDGTTFAGGLASGFTSGNKNLKWETTYSLNAGIDFSLLRNRLSGSFDYYDMRTKDLLMNRTVPIMNGYTTLTDNVGKTQNKGFELSLVSINVESGGFQWKTAAMLSGNWSKILALKEDGKDDVANKWFIGKPISVHYDYKVVGIWQTEEAEEAKKFAAIPGDAKLQRSTEGSKLEPNDRVVIGSKLPVWTAGLTNTFTYKNWSIAVFLSGVFDVTTENETVKFERQMFEKNTNYIHHIDYWTPERQSNKYTRLGYNNSNHNFYTDASYLRIQDINLSYNFSQQFLDRLRLKGLTVYANARNLYTFAEAKKYTTNLEQGNATTLAQEKFSLDASGYPVPRIFIVGLNITF